MLKIIKLCQLFIYSISICTLLHICCFLTILTFDSALRQGRPCSLWGKTCDYLIYKTYFISLSTRKIAWRSSWTMSSTGNQFSLSLSGYWYGRHLQSLHSGPLCLTLAPLFVSSSPWHIYGHWSLWAPLLPSSPLFQKLLAPGITSLGPPLKGPDAMPLM